MAEQFGEKSQEATQHRRQKAREEGQVAKSQDLGSAVLLLVGVFAILLLGPRTIDFLAELTKRQLGGTAVLSADLEWTVGEVHGLLEQIARNVLPIMGVCLFAAVAINVAQVGFLFLPQKLAIDFSRLDPIKGMGRLVSITSVARLGFGLFKILVIMIVAGYSLYGQREAILGLTAVSLPQVAAFLVEVLLWTSIKIAIALAILAVLDYAFQRWKHEQDLMMTQQEVREEMKNMEGDPQVAARRRAVQRQLAMNRLSTAVPKADVIVTNPTELAVAIQYDPDTMAAPVVVAKGAGHAAERIRKVGLEHGVPIVERKELARALYRNVEINHPIPQERYAAVAEVLAYVYQLKGKTLPNQAA